MSLVKLNHEETLLLSKKLQELNELHQQVIAKETKASFILRVIASVFIINTKSKLYDYKTKVFGS